MKSKIETRPADAAPARAWRVALTALLVFAVAFAIRLVHVWSFRKNLYFEKPVLDAKLYDDWAQRIVAGEWIGKTVFEGVPLYPYVLSLVYRALGSGAVTVALVQSAIGSAGIALLYLYCRLAFSETLALVTAGLGAIYAPFLFYESFRLADGLATFFTSAVLYSSFVLLKQPTPGRAAATGVVLGLATLARERFLLFAPLLGVFLLWRHRRGVATMARPILAAALYGFGLTLPLGLSLAHNVAAASDPVLLSSAGGVNFYIGNHPGASGSFDPPRELGRNRDELYMRARVIAEQAEHRSLKASEVSSYWTSQGLKAWRTDPASLFKLLIRKIGYFWKGFEISDAMDYYGSLSDSVVLSLPLPSFRIVGPLALVGLVLVWRLRRRDPAGIVTLYGLLAAHVAFLALFFVTSRFRVSAIPCLLPFAAATLVWLGERIAARRFAAAAAAAVACGLAAVFVNVDPEFNAAVSHEATSHASRGMMLFEQKRYPEAEKELREAVKIWPQYGKAKYYLARALDEQKRPDEAYQMVQEAVANDPTYGRARAYLGKKLMERGQAEQALPQLLQALKDDPRQGLAAFWVGSIYQAKRNPSKAVEYYRLAAKLEPSLAADAEKRIAELQGP